MTLRRYDLRDPGEVVGQILAAHQPADGDAYLALVHDPSGAQELVHVTPVASATWSAMADVDRSDFLRERVQAMPLDCDSWRPPEHAVVTVVVRSGLAVFGDRERDWLLAWRYANHLAPAFTIGPVLVTEHGWVDFATERGGCTPHARWRDGGLPARN